MPRPAAALTSCLLALAGCAPDAVKPSDPFDAWVNRVAQTCNYQVIGSQQVGSLLGMNASEPAIVVLDATSRLYFGRISADQWTATVTTELNGRPTDPGVGCVLGQLPKP
jgi:hypothetical protein